MPMDYDDNEFNVHNVELAEEVSSTVTPVLRPYDYEDGGHLSFDSLVENEVFLGITGQEDNQWIEEYSRGASVSAAESRHNNVWFEATSSESVEMLLNSVGHEAFMTESNDEPGSLPTNMDPNLKQGDQNDHCQEAMVTNKDEVLDASDEPGGLATNVDPNSKQDDGTSHAQEAMVTNKEEGALTTEELDTIDELGSLPINMDPNLKQDDESSHVHEAMVTNKEVGPSVTEELDASDDHGKLTTNMDPNMEQDDGNNHSQEAIIINTPQDHASGSSSSFCCDEFYVTTTKESQEGTLATEELDASDHAQEVMVTNKEMEALVTEELDVSDEPRSLAIHMDPSLKQDNETNHAQEVMVTNIEVETLATEEIDVSDEPGSSAVKMDSNLKQDDEDNHAQVMVSNKEVEALATEELNVSDGCGILAMHIEPNLKLDDETNHGKEVTVTNKEVKALVTEELDVSDDDIDSNLKQDDGTDHVYEAMVTNKEVGDLATEELGVSDEPGSPATNMDHILKQDDEINHAQEAMVTSKDVEALVIKELDASDDPDTLHTNVETDLKQDDGNNHAQEATLINKPQDHFSGSGASSDYDKFYVPTTKVSQEEGKVSGGELVSDILYEINDLSEENIDDIHDDVNHEARDMVVELSENKPQDDLSTPKVECGNLDASTENMDNPNGCTAVETCTNSDEGPIDLGSIDKPPFEVDIPVNEESMPAGSCNLVMTTACAEVSHDSKCAVDGSSEADELNNDITQEDLPPVTAVNESCNLMMTTACAEVSHDSKCSVIASSEPREHNNDLMHEDIPQTAVENDDRTKSENVASLESNDCSQSKVSDVQSPRVEELESPSGVFDPTETVEGSSIIDVGFNLTNTCSSPELLASNTDPVPAPKALSGNSNHMDQSPPELSDQSPAELSGSVQQQENDEIQSSEQDGATCSDHNMEGNEKLPLNMDIASLDGHKNLQSLSSAEGCKAQGSEGDTTISAEQVTTGYTDAKSPLFEGTSSVHNDNEGKTEGGFVSDETRENKSFRVAISMVDPSLSVVETHASPDSAGKVLQEPSVENKNEQALEANPGSLGGCSTPSTVDSIPCDSSAKVGDDVEAGGSMRESSSGHQVDLSREQLASTSSHMGYEEDSSVSMDKLQSVSPLLNTDNTDLSQITTVKPSEGVLNETISLSEATEDIQREEQSISSNVDMKTDKSFTFEFSATVKLGETGKGLQTSPAPQVCNLSTTMEVPCIDPNSSTFDTRKLNEASVTPQTPGSGTIRAGAKERKTRRKSAGKESMKKTKETTTIQEETLSPLLVTPSPASAAAAGHAIQFQDLSPKVECSVTKPPTVNLPDLNNATCIFHQPFTNNQQVQLRAQILVYGSLISGMPPEEPHMIAAFGQSDAGRKTWEAAWHASLERLHGQKSEANTPAMQQSLSDLKDVSNRTPDLGIKHSGILSSSNKGTPPAVSPLIPVSSPLWNMSTPSHVGFQSRNAAFQQPFTPLHPSIYQTPPNPLWLSQGSFLGQWGVASSPSSVTPRLSALPRIEAVKLTPVNVSGGGSQTYSMPVVHSNNTTDGKKPPSDLKSRKRKKVTAAAISVPSQVLLTPFPHPVPDTMSHNRHRFPFLVESQTDSITPPVVTTILSTSAVSTPHASKRVEKGNVQEADVQASSDARSMKRTKITSSPSINQTPVPTPVRPGSDILSLAQNQTISVTAPVFCTSFPTSVATPAPAITHGYQKMENTLAVEETLSKVNESKLQAENAALLAAAEVSNCQDVWSRLDSRKASDVVSDAETKLMSSASAAAAVAKMASAAAKMASNVTEQAKLLADEVFLSSKTENSSHDVVNKATPASILKSMDKTTDTHPNSIISAAREAARRRIEAASAASKHAENLDAIIKAAELAAEAVSQVGKILAIHDSSALKKLAEAGPEGFWKISQSANGQHKGGEVSGLYLNSGNSGKKSIANVSIEETQTSKHGPPPPVHVPRKQKMLVIDDASISGNEKDIRTSNVPNLSMAIGISTETSISAIWEEHNIKEGCLIEVYKEADKYRGAWLAANVLSLKDEKALVCYTGNQSSDEGSEKVKEWVTFEVVGSEEVPRIRIAHPMTVMRFEGARKRRRTAVTDYAWSKGDRVDVWLQDCWREGVVMEPNKIDVTTLTVQFPAGETSVVRSWHVRPTLIWKDRKWMEWKGGHASQGESPKEKRIKLGSPDKLPTNAPLLTAQERCFNVGKSTNKLNTSSTATQKERARVVFGVPKPGKKQKFMDVSAQYVDDRNNRNHTKSGSLKFSKPPGSRAPKTVSTENQVPETKPRLKPRKPPVPSFRPTTSRDSEPTNSDSVEKSSSSQNHTQVGSSFNNRRDQAKAPTPKKGFSFTSKPKSEHVNKGGRVQPTPKIEAKESSNSQANEPRRSNRKIQPTSRLLEGLQTSLTISKIPSFSHAGQKKVTPKGNSCHET